MITPDPREVVLRVELMLTTEGMARCATSLIGGGPAQVRLGSKDARITKSLMDGLIPEGSAAFVPYASARQCVKARS